MPILQEQRDLWLFEFKLHGIIHLPGLLPEDLADAMDRQFQEFLSMEVELDERGQAMTGRGERRYALPLGGVLDTAGGPMNDPRARHPDVVEELVTAILGRWRFSKLIVECPCPGSDYMGWHIDAETVPPESQVHPKPTRVLKLQIALVDVDDACGPMEIIPGSHRMYYTEGDAALRNLPRSYGQRLTMKRGDAFLRDGELIHRGTPNRSSRPRPLYSQIYKIVD
ncbi:MAG: phytanoyl-CoA dioxygenase family protein [Candidatus Polarisedimenticolia bacterium]